MTVAGATGLGSALGGPAGAVAANNEAANNGALGLARGAVLGSELLAAACAKNAVCVKLVGADALAAVLGTGAAALITFGDINPHVFGGAEVFEGQDGSKQPTNTGNNKPAPSYGTNTGNTNPAPNYGTNTATPNNGPQQGGATVYPAPQGGEQGGNVAGGGFGAGTQPVVNPGVMASTNSGQNGNGPATHKPVSDLLDDANTPVNSSGLSQAARAWDKHDISRPGGTFEPLTGNTATKNGYVSGWLNDLLKNPQTTRTDLPGGGVEYRLPNGQGARFESNGKVNLLDPPWPK